MAPFLLCMASRTSPANAAAMELLLSLLSAAAAAAAPDVLPGWKQPVKQGRHRRHCRMLLAKQVLPRLRKPTTACMCSVQMGR
jgi:hypothetical protein